MNRRDLVKAVAAHTGLEGRQVDETLRGFQDVVTAVVAKGEPVSISGFAKFAKVERPARMGRNPATGEPIRIKASKKARITAMKAFKDSVMNPSQAPKLARGVWPLEPSGAAPARKTTAKKAPARKTNARTAAPVKKAPVGKATATKATARKTTARKTTATKAPARKATPVKKAARRR